MTSLFDLPEPAAFPEPLAVVEAGIEQLRGGGLTPELLRVKGERLLLHDTKSAPEAAADLFRQALDWACRRQLLSWELTAATSLVRLLRDQGRRADGTTCLRPLYDRFTKDFGTADLFAAKQLLDQLGAGGHR